MGLECIRRPCLSGVGKKDKQCHGGKQNKRKLLWQFFVSADGKRQFKTNGYLESRITEMSKKIK